MAASIETQSLSKKGVPYWALDHLLDNVLVVKDFDYFGDGRFVYHAGYVGVLTDVLSEGTTLVAGVQFLEGDGGVGIPFDYIKPWPDPYLAIPGRAGEVAMAWRAGVDVRKRLSRSTFHRYRKQLLEFGIDIHTKIEPSPVTK